MQAQAPDRPGPVSKNLGPGPVKTDLGPGPVNTNWGPGPVNKNWWPGLETGAGLGARARARGRGRKIHILMTSYNQRLNRFYLSFTTSYII